VAARYRLIRCNTSSPRLVSRPDLAMGSTRICFVAVLDINDGVDVRLVQEFLGHASINSTAVYTAISPKRLAGVRVR
jgi:integrase